MPVAFLQRHLFNREQHTSNGEHSAQLCNRCNIFLYIQTRVIGILRRLEKRLYKHSSCDSL